MGTKGYKSTEFWMTLAVIILNALIASDALPVGSMWEKLVLMGVSILAALGYQFNRTVFKSKKLESDTIAGGNKPNP